MALPRVFFDIAIDSEFAGRFVVELRSDVVPKTCDNFRALCTGEKGFGYKGSTFQCISQGFLCSADVFDSPGDKSICGNAVEPENFNLKHDGLGILSMAMVERGPDVSSSEFCIWMTRDPWFDGKYVVFGRVVEGIVVIKKIVASGDSDGNPTNTVTIVDCNVYNDTVSHIEMPHTPLDPFFVPLMKSAPPLIAAKHPLSSLIAGGVKIRSINISGILTDLDHLICEVEMSKETRDSLIKFRKETIKYCEDQQWNKYS